MLSDVACASFHLEEEERYSESLAAAVSEFVLNKPVPAPNCVDKGLEVELHGTNNNCEHGCRDYQVVGCESELRAQVDLSISFDALPVALPFMCTLANRMTVLETATW